MSNDANDIMDRLSLLDPESASSFRAVSGRGWEKIGAGQRRGLEADIQWSLTREVSFGRAVADGYARLVANGKRDALSVYGDQIRKAGEKSAFIGRIVASRLIPVLLYGNGLVNPFIQTVDTLLEKGGHALPGPMEALETLLGAGDTAGARAYLCLLHEVFRRDINYARCRLLCHILPPAVLSLPARKRADQVDALRRVSACDPDLLDSFIEGMERGLRLLSGGELSRFVDMALKRYRQEPRSAKTFLSLDSRIAEEILGQVRVSVPLVQVKTQLERYLQARTGLFLPVRPLSALAETVVGADGPAVCSDGHAIYLPEEIGSFPTRGENEALYRFLAGLEAGCCEFGTFDFDMERASFRYGLKIGEDAKGGGLGDLDAFFSAFAVPELACDLFTAFEHGRIRFLLERSYPGLMRRVRPLLVEEIRRIFREESLFEPVFLLYARIAVDSTEGEGLSRSSPHAGDVCRIASLFEGRVRTDSSPEGSGDLVARVYPEMEGILTQAYGAVYPALITPFARKIRPELYEAACGRFRPMAEAIRMRLRKRNIRVYAADIRRVLSRNNGILNRQGLREILDQRMEPTWDKKNPALGSDALLPQETDADDSSRIFWYREWDAGLGDYLHRHVRVSVRPGAGKSGDFYSLTLKRYGGLVRRVRRAFEQLRPEGCIRLRPWVEGDEFDSRRLVDFVVDRKMGRVPSDRLYIKSLKQARDVAVLLLVDLSRSTAGQIPGSAEAVIDVEKAALVLFCEALAAAGDAFAVAGFSGNGRLGVDYLPVKALEEQMSEEVRSRIGALSPRRNTRMGAAVRHGAFVLEQAPRRVRLLILLTDGFPNDLEYKGEHAVADTRKAVQEARAKDIHVHAVTVSPAGDSRLDALYGSRRHTVIADVRELPDRLLRVYGLLTR